MICSNRYEIENKIIVLSCNELIYISFVVYNGRATINPIPLLTSPLLLPLYNSSWFNSNIDYSSLLILILLMYSNQATVVVIDPFS